MHIRSVVFECNLVYSNGANPAISLNMRELFSMTNTSGKREYVARKGRNNAQRASGFGLILLLHCVLRMLFAIFRVWLYVHLGASVGLKFFNKTILC
jgi:hypothetical protein